MNKNLKMAGIVARLKGAAVVCSVAAWMAARQFNNRVALKPCSCLAPQIWLICKSKNEHGF
jgi:hypothetical protein